MRHYPTRIERHQHVTDSLWSVLIGCIKEDPKRATRHLIGAVVAAVLLVAVLYNLADINAQGTIALGTVAERLAGMVGR
jgi:hypothetical protein